MYTTHQTYHLLFLVRCTEPYKTISLRDTQTATRGTPAGTEIGIARARAFEHRSGTDGTGDDIIAMQLVLLV